MQLITLKTEINAPIDECFDLSRSIDLHLDSMKTSNEKAIAGKTTGLIDLNESVTWLARHFGIRFKMTSQVTDMKKPYQFMDEMVKGPFKSLKHLHYFNAKEESTEMLDVFEFEAPLGFLGWIAEHTFLRFYMKRLLCKRNAIIKLEAENLCKK
ncbi:SRPBCC family protein [Pedobacter sp. AW1-32]|uniref:SRPBCC family protein n=1 Tax=Pedobacter sp. AW1-32 TaxID=3383026 RepID=UPI003FEF4BC7